MRTKAVTNSPVPESITAAALARITGLVERTIASRKQSGGLPPSPDGSIDLHAIIRAGVEALAKQAKAGTPAGNVDEARIRLLTAQAEAREMLNEQMRGVAVLAEDMEAGVGALVEAARARLLAIPTKAVPLLVGKTNPAEVREVLTEAVHEACGDLAASNAAAAVRHRAFVRAGNAARPGEGGEEVGTPS